MMLADAAAQNGIPMKGANPMLQRVHVNGQDYVFASGYRDDDALRRSLNRLTRATYGFDFEPWYQAGYWRGQYLPYSLLDGEKMVSNVSVTIQDCCFLGESKRFVQLGTVMTDRACRGRGLGRLLMERVLEDWQGASDMLYLYANDSVLDYYPKFGFVKADEYQCFKTVAPKAPSAAVRKMDMTDPDEQEKLYRAVSHSARFAQISMPDNAGLVLFYALSFLKNSVYHIEHCDAVAVAQYEGDTLFLLDVFCADRISLDEVIEALSTEQTKRVVLGFTPLNPSAFEQRLLWEEDTTLFVRAAHACLPGERRCRFPALSHA